MRWPIGQARSTDGAKGGVFNADEDPGRVRQAESQRALKALGIWERCELRAWAYPDQALMPGQDLVKAMLQCMQDFKPDVVLAPSPFESHADHRVASLCTYWAWQQSQRRSMRAHAQVSTPEFALEASPQLMFYEVGQPLPANVLVDISTSMDKKRSAMACFASQLAQQAYGETIEALNRY
ncbi:MAG: PIG-L deacetylase family protein, partial [Burkholderiaceae bacterium]